MSAKFDLPTMGAVGLGLVWGWLLVLVAAPSRRRWRTGAALAGATAALVLLPAALGLPARPAVVGAATAAGLTVHLAWRLALRAAAPRL